MSWRQRWRASARRRFLARLFPGNRDVLLDDAVDVLVIAVPVTKRLLDTENPSLHLRGEIINTASEYAVGEVSRAIRERMIVDLSDRVKVRPDRMTPEEVFAAGEGRATLA